MSENDESETSRFVHSIRIEAPIQAVWNTLTEAGVVQPFFFNSVLHTTRLAPGAPMRMRTPDGKYTGVVGEVLEFEAPHRYVTTFLFTNFDDPLCRVAHDLREVDGGVEYTLTSEEVPVGTRTAKQMSQGGALITEVLKATVEGRRPAWKYRFILKMISLFSFASPKQSRSEHWGLDGEVLELRAQLTGR